MIRRQRQILSLRGRNKVYRFWNQLESERSYPAMANMGHVWTERRRGQNKTLHICLCTASSEQTPLEAESQHFTLKVTVRLQIQ